MKWFTLITIALLSLTSLGEEYRTFTDQQGRIIKAKLISFDSKSGKITIERNNRKKATVSPTIFSNEDQTYINQWAKASLLNDKRNIKFSIAENIGDLSEYEKFTVTAANGGVDPFFTRFYESSFMVEIENKSQVDFEKVQLEYCLFIKRKGYGKIEDIMYCELGDSTGELKPLSKVSFQTSKVNIFECYKQQSNNATAADGPIEYFKTKNAIEEIEGVIFRLRTADNKDTFLEFSEPAGFIKKHKWNEYRARIGKEKLGREK